MCLRLLRFIQKRASKQPHAWMSRWLLKLAFFNWLKSRNCIKIGPKCILLLPITRDVVATPCPTLLLFHPGFEPAMAESKMHKLHIFWIFNRLMLMTPCCGRTFSINTSLRLNEPVWRISSTYWKHFVTPHSSSVSNIWHYTETAVQYGRFCGRGNSPYVDIKRSMQANKTTIHVLHTMKSHVLTIHPFVLASMDS